MSFFAIDVETANADYSSICQIGIVHFKDGQIVDKWSSLVNPEAYFDPFNTSIHGITEKDVKDAPSFDVIYNQITEKITDKITVHHMPFDKIAITRACLEYQLEIIQPKWLDSAKIARRTWEQFAYKGYGLANIADYLGIEFGHHDALEDAIAAAKIVHYACEYTKRSVEEWLTRVGQPIFTYQGGSSTVKLQGNPEGSLYGENLVFTGALYLPRKDTAKIAAELGCNVGNSVSKKTSILVVGTQDTTKLAGYEKSSKHRKAEELIQEGANIKILSEDDFIEMCNNENNHLKLEVPKPRSIPQKPIKQEQTVEKPDMTIKIQIDKTYADEIIKALDNLTEEQKKAAQEYLELLDSIKDCSQEDKRRLAKEFKAIIETVENLYEQLDIKAFEDYKIAVIDNIAIEIEQLRDLLYGFMKDKITLAEFYKTTDNSIDYIESDFEDGSYPKPVTDYCNSSLTELKKIKVKILTHANKQDSGRSARPSDE